MTPRQELTLLKRGVSVVLFIVALLDHYCGHETVNLSPLNTVYLQKFKEKEKFLPDDELFYPGLADTTLRSELTEKINLIADDFDNLSSALPEPYHDAIKHGLARFEPHYSELDTEDRERICTYIEELMDIVGLKTSGGHLNDFMYGFDPSE